MLQDFYSQGVAQLGLFDEYKPRHNSEQLMGGLIGSITRGGQNCCSQDKGRIRCGQ